MAELTENIIKTTKMVSGDAVSFDTPRSADIKSLKVHFSPQQAGSGNASPDNVREISGWNDIEVYHKNKNIAKIVGFSAKTYNTPQSVKDYTNTYGTTLSTVDYALPDTPVIVTQSQIDKTQANYHYHNGYFCIILDGLEYDTYYNVSFRVSDIVSNPLDVTIDQIRIRDPSQTWFSSTRTIGDRVIFTQYFHKQHSSYPERNIILIYHCGMSFTLSEFMVTPVSDNNYEWQPYSYNKKVVQLPPNGKNLLDLSQCDMQAVWISGKKGDSSAGTGTSYVGSINYIPCNHLAGKTITLNHRSSGSNPGFAFYDRHYMFISGVKNNNVTAGTPMTVEVPENAYYFRFTTLSQYLDDLQIEIGSEATEYEPFNNTFYGGYIDLVTGEAVKTYDCFTAKLADADNKTVYNNCILYTYHIEKDSGPAINNNKQICNIAPYQQNSQNENVPHFYLYSDTALASNNISALVFMPPDVDENTEVQIAYQLEAPIRYTLTPIELKTFVRINYIWSNASSVEVEYEHITEFYAMPSRQNIMMDSPHVETASGVIANFSTDIASDVKDLKVYFEPIQYGTGNPSPDNVRELEGRGTLQLYSYGENKCQVIPSTTTNYGVTWAVNADGSIDFDGTPTSYSGCKIGRYWTKGGETLYGMITGDAVNVAHNAATICWVEGGTWKSKSVSPDSALLEGIDVSEYPGNVYLDAFFKRANNGMSMHGKCFLTIDDKPIDINTYDFVFLEVKNLFNKASVICQNGTLTGETFTNTQAGSANQLNILIRTMDYKGYAMQAFSYSNVQIGKFTATCTFNKPCSRLQIMVLASSYNFNMILPWSLQGTYTISFDVVNNDVNTVGGLVIQNIQIEEGSQATEFEPFNNACYGGYIDFTTGEFVKEYDCITFTGNENWNYNRTVTTLGVEKHELYSNALDSVAAFDTPSKCKSNIAVVHSGDNRAADISIGFGTPSYAFFVSINSSLCDGTADSFKAYLSEHPLQVVYPLKTPVRYQITPHALKTLKGINNVWSNGGGTVEVSYLKRGDDSVQRLPMQGYTTDDNYVIITSDGYTIGEEEDYIEY